MVWELRSSSVWDLTLTRDAMLCKEVWLSRREPKWLLGDALLRKGVPPGDDSTELCDPESGVRGRDTSVADDILDGTRKRWGDMWSGPSDGEAGGLGALRGPCEGPEELEVRSVVGDVDTRTRIA
mmetsp:Transcript_36561/g.97439  ORF Transcript_36561/g.97439 Transcript_36561/m.97439 type:complete len:125 (+) Transcript_36561:1663-2037(+)